MRPEAIVRDEIQAALSDRARSALDCTPHRSPYRRRPGEDRTTILDRPLVEAEWDKVRTFVRLREREDLRLRFGRPLNFDDEATLRRAFDLKGGSGEMAWLLDGDAAIAAIAHRITLSRSEAEIALIVRSDVQRRGIGEFLLRQALGAAGPQDPDRFGVVGEPRHAASGGENRICAGTGQRLGLGAEARHRSGKRGHLTRGARMRVITRETCRRAGRNRPLCEPFRVLGECRHSNQEQQQTHDAELKPEIFLVGHVIHPSIAFKAGAEPTKFG